LRSSLPIVDQLVATRIRERRKSLDLTLRVLAERVDVTVQQLWRYERCKNNVSAGLLYEIASALHTSPEYFFDSLVEQAPPPLPPRQRLMLDLVRSLHQIESKDHWGALRALVRALTTHTARANVTAVQATDQDRPVAGHLPLLPGGQTNQIVNIVG
jgi:transcriptional regulator with XRE-family HTH domain